MAKGYKEFIDTYNEDRTFDHIVEAKGRSIAETEEGLDDKELLVRVGEALGFEFTVEDVDMTAFPW